MRVSATGSVSKAEDENRTRTRPAGDDSDRRKALSEQKKQYIDVEGNSTCILWRLSLCQQVIDSTAAVRAMVSENRCADTEFRTSMQSLFDTIITRQ